MHVPVFCDHEYYSIAMLRTSLILGIITLRTTSIEKMSIASSEKNPCCDLVEAIQDTNKEGRKEGRCGASGRRNRLDDVG